VPTNPVPLPQHNKQSSPPVVDLARQSRFQMDDDGDLHEQILHIEAHIEELTDIIERCRKIILISKVAIRWLRLSEQNFRVDKWRLCRG
jgi:hypothetical protein